MIKKIFLFLILFMCFPYIVNAYNVNEYPPYVNVRNEHLYDIEKIINDDYVIVRLKKKNDLTYYSWSFDKKKIGDKINLDFEITHDDNEIIKGMIDENIKIKYLNFRHHGTLPSQAKVTVYVGDKFGDKDRLNLYYYNDDNKKIEHISEDLKITKGYVEFTIDHCSSYFLTNSYINDISNSPSFNYVLLVLIVVVILVMAKFLYSVNAVKEG